MVEPLGNETLLALQVGDDLINLRAGAAVNPAVGSTVRRPCRPPRTSICSTQSRFRHRQTTRPATDGAEHERPQQT